VKNLALNWNPEVIVDFIVATIGIISAILTYVKPKSKNLLSLFFIRLAIWSMSLLMLVDGISLLIVSEELGILTGMFAVLGTLFLIIGVNYIMKESFYSFGFTLTFGISILFLYLGFQPGAIETRIQSGYIRLPWIGLYGDLGFLLIGILEVYMFYWGVKTLKNAPFLLKKEAIFFFIGIVLISPVTFLFYLLYIFQAFYILVSDFSTFIGVLILTTSFIIEPKLFYILPFTVYRIVVKDNKGNALFDYDWSESMVSENVFIGFVNAVQLMSKEIMNIGGLLDINLKDGILILHESEYITVGLVTSKSSKLLRDSVTKFTFDFEDKFQKQLKESCHDMKEYEAAFELINKYFSNFPSRIIPHKSHPLLLTDKLLKLPASLESDLKNLFPDEEEYNYIKSEIFRAPESSAESFISLYNEIKEELEKREKKQKEEPDHIEML
jgi:hypothetical protein